MKIFVTYASEDRPIADELAVRLRTEGYTVFLDRDNLSEGEGYDAEIRAAIAACDLYLFLVSPHSVQAGRYTLTELRFAREVVPNPRGRVLPVMSEPTPFNTIPSYLSAVTVLQPQGNLVAETVAKAGRLLRQRARMRWLRIGAGVLVLLLAAGVFVLLRTGITPAQPCMLAVAVTGPPVEGLAIDVTSPAGTTAFRLSAASTQFELGPFEQQDFTWSIRLRRRDGAMLGSERTFSGCPRTRMDVDLGDDYGLVVEPR